MLAEIARVYRETRKEREQYWAKYMTRPFAAAVIVAIRNTRISPNQVTLIAFLTSLVGAVLMVGWQTHAGLVTAVLVYQLAYIFDCVDGQLARLKGISSPEGGLLDFLFDEIKAVVLFASVSARLYFIDEDPMYLLVGLFGVALVSSGLSLTTFLRRPEVAGPKPPPPDPDAPPPARSLISRALGGVRQVASWGMNYPIYIVYLAIFDVIEVFFWLFVALYLLFTAQTFLQIIFRFGRPTPRPSQGA